MSVDSAMRCRISGRVQGVCYRASTQRQAEQLGLSGEVSNLSDGSVEVYAEGPAGKLDLLQRWLWQGPEHAEVTAVVCHPVGVSSAGVTGFTVIR